MKKKVKWILAGVVAILIVGYSVYSMVKPITTELTEVAPEEAQMYFIEEGDVVSPEQVDVYAQVQGEILEINVVENQEVLTGDVICVVDSSEYVYQKQQMESNIQGYEAQKSNLSTQQAKEKDALQATRNDLTAQLEGVEEQKQTSTGTKSEQLALQNEIIAQNEANLVWANDNLQKAELLYGGGVLSEQEYNEAKQEVDRAQSALDQSKQQLNVIENTETTGSAEYYDTIEDSINAQISGIDKQLQKDYTGAMGQYYDAQVTGSYASILQLDKKIEDCTIKAPVDGIVGEVYIENTNVVSASSPVISITKEGEMEVEVFVSTNDIDYINVGDKVELILKRRDGDKVYTGAVSEIDEEAVETANALGVTEKSVKVKIIPDDLEPFKTGYDVDVKFIFYDEKDKLTVPKTALFKDGETDMVWAVRNGKAEMQPVKKGVELQTEVVIEEGLNAGDFVVVDADIEGVKAGAKVTDEK